MSTYNDRRRDNNYSRIGWESTTEKPTKNPVYYSERAVARKYMAGLFTGIAIGLALGVLLLAL